MTAYLFTVTDPQKREIWLTEECYVFHVLVEHPDMSDVKEIAQTIRTPDYITQDEVDFMRLVYYRMGV